MKEAKETDVLEVDEIWSFVGKKTNKRWLWAALCRRTRQIIAFAIGDRSEATCRRLWEAIPDNYRKCQSYSDFWSAYESVFPKITHELVSKDAGELAHIERWNNTVRQRLARYTRQTLSFSKSDNMHEIVTKCFIIEYNLHVSFTI